MPSIGIRIVYAGNNSEIGHMYVVFVPDNGPPESYGQYPVTRRDAFGGRGNVLAAVDYRDHELQSGSPGTNGVPDIKFDFPVSQYHFDKALNYALEAESHAGDLTKKWGNYKPFTNSCVDFAWNILKQAGLDDRIWFEGNQLPQSNTGPLSVLFYEYFRRAEFNREARRLPADVNAKYLQGNTIRPRDPLAIDLDGDGIETVGIAGSAVLFDHNADGIKTGTGWVKGDDAWLVLDRNGDGLDRLRT